MTVVAFQRKEVPKPKVYVCNCRCENFWLYQDGRVECAECNTFHEDMRGYWKIIAAAEPA